MPVQLYDTLSRSIRELMPEDGRQLRFYCCGPTVYGPAHIGNFRTFLLQDVLRRVLEVDGTQVRHVRNITNVDDKTIRGAREKGVSLGTFTAEWTEKFHGDCEALNMLPPHLEPGAVEHIPQQIALVEKLIENGNAYATEDGSVYFRIHSFQNYGQLAKLKQNELQPRRDSPDAPQEADEYDRESVADFALWKHRKPEDGENYWPSPWGEGRPGWHLECSAMVDSAFGGRTIDLHGGGIDLCFPHHENEIAQSECAHGRTFCHHWFHVAHLMVEGEKMSKSLGNLHTLDDLRKKGFSPMTIRYTLIAGSFRQQLNFTFDGLHASQSALTRMERFADTLLEKTGQSRDALDAYIRPPEEPVDFGPFDKAWEALRNNLNTAACLGAIFGVIGTNPGSRLDAEGARKTLRSFGALLYALGLRLFASEAEKQEVPPEIRALADERWAAKKARDFARADALRDELLEKGWAVKDGKEGYELTVTFSAGRKM